MSISKEVRELVRQRADFACEFCGVTETDTGGELTIDHFQPTARGGSDNPVNLLYCCNRCNLYKLAYYPVSAEDPVLWNPRQEPFVQHFLELENGALHPLTSAAEFTLNRLRLNRPPLVSYRLKNRQIKDNIRLLNRYRELVELQNQLNVKLAELTAEQKFLLEEQQRLLKMLLGRTK